jgi:hypothetical protein
MREAGIENPDAREYWRGFNSFFEPPAAVTIMLRNVPEPLRRAVKAKAAADGKSMQAAAIELMRRWVEEK